MISIREQFGKTLTKVSSKNKEIIVVSCDLESACKLKEFRKKFPSRFVETGIAEANAIGIASGIGMAGYRTVLASFASFITGKNIEIRMSVSYNNAPVIIVGTHGGMIGADGATQSGLQDISVMRSIPNFKIFQPCSNIETDQIIKYALKDKSPTYIRIARNVVPEILNKKYKFKPKIGINYLIKGKKIAVISSGSMVYNCLKAITNINSKNDFSLINISKIKPINKLFVKKIAEKHKIIVTIEDHSTEGGIGSLINETLSSYKKKNQIYMMGITDQFISSDNPTNLEKHYGLSPSKIKNFLTKINNKK